MSRSDLPPETPLRPILDAMADGIVIVDQQGTVSYVNPAAQRMLGRRAQDLTGRQFGLPLVAGESIEVDLLAENGAPAVAEMRVVQIDWEGRPGALAALRDITRRKQDEEARHALVREQAARAAAEEAVRDRDTFLSVAAHELKTPITSLTVAVQLLLRLNRRTGGMTPEILDRNLTVVDQQVRKLAEMVGRVLDVSRVQVDRLTLDREPADVVSIVESAVALVTPKAGARTFTVRNPAGGPIVAEVDPLRLEQVIINLLDNGVQFSPDRSEIEIDLAREDEALSIAVRDHGLGIALEDRELVFERFYQAYERPHSPGFGLGLYICKQIVELHGGTIEAIGPKDGGTVVLVKLPLAAPSSAASEEPSLPAWPSAA